MPNEYNDEDPSDDDSDYGNEDGKKQSKIGLSSTLKLDVMKGCVIVERNIYSKLKENAYGTKSKSSIIIKRSEIGNSLMQELKNLIKDNGWNFDLNMDGNRVAICSNNRVDMNVILKNMINNNKSSPDEYYVVAPLNLIDIEANAISKHTLVLLNENDKQSVFDLKLREKGGLNEIEKVKSQISGFLSKLKLSVQSAFLSKSFDNSLFFNLLTGSTGPFVPNMRFKPEERMNDIFAMINSHVKDIINHYQYEQENQRLENGPTEEGVIRSLCTMIISAHNERQENKAFRRKQQEINDLTGATPSNFKSGSSSSSSNLKSGSLSSNLKSGSSSSISSNLKRESSSSSSMKCESSSSKIDSNVVVKTDAYKERIVDLIVKEIDNKNIAIVNDNEELNIMKQAVVQSQADLVEYEASIDPLSPQPVQTRMLQSLTNSISAAQNAILQKVNEIETKENDVRILQEDINAILYPHLDTEFNNDTLEICDACHLLIENCECQNGDVANESDDEFFE